MLSKIVKLKFSLAVLLSLGVLLASLIVLAFLWLNCASQNRFSAAEEAAIDAQFYQSLADEAQAKGDYWEAMQYYLQAWRADTNNSSLLESAQSNYNNHLWQEFKKFYREEENSGKSLEEFPDKPFLYPDKPLPEGIPEEFPLLREPFYGDKK